MIANLAERMEREWTQEEAKTNALQLHPECTYAEVHNGLSWNLRTTWVIKLWRNEECYLAGDPARHTEQSYPTRRPHLSLA